jgi:hypothetical protein
MNLFHVIVAAKFILNFNCFINLSIVIITTIYYLTDEKLRIKLKFTNLTESKKKNR